MNAANASTAIDEIVKAVEEAAFARGYAKAKSEAATAAKVRRAITIEEVCDRLALGETSIRALMVEDPSFPKPFSYPGNRRKLWHEHQIDAYLEQC